jgi:hypothetical protein
MLYKRETGADRPCLPSLDAQTRKEKGTRIPSQTQHKTRKLQSWKAHFIFFKLPCIWKILIPILKLIAANSRVSSYKFHY